ncbi:MAG: nucleotidyltransferase [Bacillota bacterium]
MNEQRPGRPPEGPDPSPAGAAAEVARFLDGLSIPYVVIGGLAVQLWGEPRATHDVDMTVLLPGGAAERRFLEECVERFHPRIPDAVTFALRHRVLLISATNGCPVDIALGVPGYEPEVIRRAVLTSLAGYPVKVIGVEDLIIHKCVAGRPRDLEDVKAILIRQPRVDLRYIRRWLEQFSLAVPERDPLGAFEALLRTVRRRRRTRPSSPGRKPGN